MARSVGECAKGRRDRVGEQVRGGQAAGEQQLSEVWRWREAALVAGIWFAPIPILGSTSASMVERLVSSGAIAVLVGTVLSVPLPSLQTQVTKTVSAKRVFEAVWTAATGVAVLALFGLDDRSFIAAVLGLLGIWLALAVSVAIRPLDISGDAGAAPTAVSWLPAHQPNQLKRLGKRAFDAVVAAIALVAIAPVLVVTALAIKANDGGPVLFKQRRVGQDGVPFEMFKFRSMVLNAEDLRAELEAESERSGPLFKMTNDPRITPVGRVIRELSIDELPQLFNILFGTMSLVGPRPALPDEAAQFDAPLQRRTAVRPGLTGLWQAEARSDADFQRFRDLDLRYVSTASPALDLWIILATATEVLVAVLSVAFGRLGFDGGCNDGIDLRDHNTVDLRATHNASITDGDPRPTAA